MDNPLLARLDHAHLPAFDAIRPEHVVPAIENVTRDLVRGVEALEASAPPTWEGLVEALNDLEEPLSHSWGTVEHLVRVRTTPELREAHQKAQPLVVEAGLRVAQSRALFDKLSALKAGPSWAALDGGQRRAVEHRLLSARLAGVALEGEEKARFQAVQLELESLSTSFANHVLDATKAWSKVLRDPAEVAGLPGSLKDSLAAAARASGEEGATAEAGPWRVSLDFAVVGPFLKHAAVRALREEVYRAQVTRASSGDLDNQPLIERILELRKEQAALLGLRSFAEVSLASKMAESPAKVRELLDELWRKSRGPAEEEHRALKALAARRPELGVPADEVLPWDVEFLAERLREESFDLRDEDTRPYLPLERVLAGLFDLARDLFGVVVRDATAEVATWHPDVRFFRVHEHLPHAAQGDGEVGPQVAAFYLDPYSRPADKRGGAWMDECVTRRARGERTQLPVAYLVCNQTAPTAERPSLMTFREVETLFHEFGHGLQHMLTAVGHLDVSGIHGVEWDAVELPSQFMESWCYEEDVLVGLSAHYATGEKMPADLFARIKAARTFRAASMMLRQLYFARLDLTLHDEHQPGSEVAQAVARRVAEETLVMQPLEEDRFLCGFTHIFAGGYASGYYSYKWAEVLAADAFSAFEEAGLDDRAARADTGRRFRRTVLGEGGARHPLEVFEAFRGRPPSPDALLRMHGLAS